MFGFHRNAQGEACLGGQRLETLLDSAGVRTPCYVYDLSGIASNAEALTRSIESRDTAAYAVKANSAATVLRTLRESGTGADVVSGGELQLALTCGFSPDRIVMSGVAKQDDEIDRAVAAGIRALQVESVEELARIAARARSIGQRANVSLRINPSVTVDTHANIATGHDAAKFGVQSAELAAAWDQIDQSPNLNPIGVSTHIGSLLRDIEPYLKSAKTVCEVARARGAAGKPLNYVNFGGGFGVDYGPGAVPSPAEFATAARELMTREGVADHDLVMEPGRSLVAPFGVLIASIVQPKITAKGRWAMLDAGMNDLLRPALYQAHHRIESIKETPSGLPWRVVGPVCESSDDFGQHRISDDLPEVVVIRDAGAYGFVMASEYNARPLPSEVFVKDGAVVQVSQSPGPDAWLRSRLGA